MQSEVPEAEGLSSQWDDTEHYNYVCLDAHQHNLSSFLRKDRQENPKTAQY